MSALWPEVVFFQKKDFVGPENRRYIVWQELFPPRDVFPKPFCGKEFFVKRKDDNLETIMSRYDIYTKTTEPVLRFLSKNSNLQEIDGTLEIEEITAKIDTFINV